MFKTAETTIDGELIKFSGSVTKVDKNTVAFSLFNDCGDEWEWSLIKSDGMEHHMSNASAVGLMFNKLSAKTIAQVLRYIADTLEGIQ